MKRYSFYVEIYFARNDYLLIDKEEVTLFKINDKIVKLESLELAKKIMDAIGMRLTCGDFDELQECLVLAKKVYVNLLINLNNTDISFIIDKYSLGNFIEFCKDEDSELYKEIVIEDRDNKNCEMHGLLEKGSSGCPHFSFNKLLDLTLDQKLKDSLFINNYRKYLIEDSICQSYVDNTLFSASLEKLLNNEPRPEEEIKVIDELAEYLSNRFKETCNDSYIIIKEMILNNKHKSINKRKIELIKRFSTASEVSESVRYIKKISNNRTKEIHEKPMLDIDIVFSWPILNRIQLEYAKNKLND